MAIVLLGLLIIADEIIGVNGLVINMARVGQAGTRRAR